MQKIILITGGAGFIGSHLTRLFVNKYPGYQIVNLDKLTYAGNLENLKDIEDKPNYTFVKGDIENMELVKSLFEKYHFTNVLHCAAESHVDRSIHSPEDFIQTNIVGTFTLLEAARMPGTPPVKRRMYPTKQIAVAQMRIRIPVRANWTMSYADE